MRSLGPEIRSAMLELREEGDVTEADFRFGPGFLGFDGHFPGQPILPAVCSVQAAMVMLEQRYGSVRLREIELAKFSTPATSDETLTYRCVRKATESGEVVVRTTVRRGEESIARMRLRVAFEGEER